MGTRPKKSTDPSNFLQIAVRNVDNEINHFDDVVLVSQALLLMNYTNELAGKMDIDPNLTKHQSVPYEYLTTPGSFQASLFQAFTEIKCLFGDANISMNRIELIQGVIGGEIECCLKSIRQGRSSTDTLINVSGSHIIRLTRNCGEICRASHTGFEKTKKVLCELIKGLENYDGGGCFSSESTKKQDKTVCESQKQKEEGDEQQVKALSGYVTSYKQSRGESYKHIVYNILEIFHLQSQTNTRLPMAEEDPEEATVAQILKCLKKIHSSLSSLQKSWCSLADFFDRVEQFAFKVQIPLKNMTLEESRKLTAISIEIICLCQGIASFAGVFRALCHKLLIDDLSGDRIQLERDCADEIASEQGRLKRKHEETKARLQENYETYV